MKIVFIGNETKEYEFNAPLLISEAMQKSGIWFDFPCGGSHRCGKCKIKVIGEISKMTKEERALLGDNSCENQRLACFTTALGDCTVMLEPKKSRIEVFGKTSAFPITVSHDGYGFAVDIGTTTVAVYCCDLRDGTVLGYDSFKNPQSLFGADVVSRMEYSLCGNTSTLKRLISDAVERSIIKLCDRYGILYHNAANAVITGNTVMMYMLLGYDVKGLSISPFSVDDTLGREFSAAEIGFKLLKNIKIFIPNAVSAFIGSDTVCASLCALDYLKENKNVLLVDIGTNCETVLFSGGKVYCCSAAAGPAFEGVGIEKGMSASQGAVSAVYAADGEIKTEVIGGTKPIGICGSGLIDAVATLLKLRIIDKTGALNCEKIVLDGDAYLTGSDIRKLQLAKSALISGIETLLNEAGITSKGIDKLLIAGGFGNGINTENASFIGLIPEMADNKVEFVGNAAVSGAAAILLSEKAKAAAFEFAESAETAELATSEFFSKRFIENMNF